jgi:hypothetical protein
MDGLAMIGSWVLSGGTDNTAIVALTPDQRVEPPPERHTWTVYEQKTVDHLFAADAKQEESSVVQALMVTTLGLATLKGIVLDEDEEEKKKEEEAEKKRLLMEHKCGGCC